MKMPGRQRAAALTTREAVLCLLALAMLTSFGLILFRQKSRDALQSQSAAHLRQWGIALHLHILENNGHLPSPGPSEASPDAGKAWYLSLADYLGIPDPVRNPDIIAEGLPGPLRIWADPSYRKPLVDSDGRFLFTYGVNRFLQPDLARPAYRIQELRQPAHTIFMIEKDGTDPGALPPDARFRHRRRAGSPAAHILYCDGHVALVDDAAALAFPEWPEDPPVVSSPTYWPPFPDAPEPEWR